ncbi:hypothetical protein L4X63_09300 [Geomonas sp. Red32]|uniref:hypothetical protein n=1 Tax=Geomonas sp. Red32 TaxID=2912856 RepID=UPI00202CCD5A|nr:hypothetical protein [Geomonas sp. Red32]MCM0081784.1 hypothetical protein [Geomonas sp. Red32]
MAALTKDRPTPRRESVEFARAVGAGKVIYAGALICLNAAGYAVPGSADNTLIADGCAQEYVDNSAGGDGALSVKVDKRSFRFANSDGADQITIAQIGDDCYVVDDQTVAKTNGGGARPIAGKIVDVEDTGVWIMFY